jgi:hypothetical protein
MDLNSKFRFYSYTIGTGISLLAGCVLLYAHLRIQRLNRHPGSLILGQCIAHILFDLHWVGGIPEVSEYCLIRYLIDIELCEEFGLFSEFSYYTIWGYITVLSFEIYHRIKYPTEVRYHNRILFTHAGVWMFSVIIAILFIVIGDLGPSPLGTCSIRAGSGDQYLIMLPFVLHLPIIAYCIGYSIRLSYVTGIRILRNHMLLVLMFLITITPQIVQIVIASLFKYENQIFSNVRTYTVCNSAGKFIRILCSISQTNE